MVVGNNVVDVRMVPEICEGCEDLIRYDSGPVLDRGAEWTIVCNANEDWHTDEVKLDLHVHKRGFVPALEYKCRRIGTYRALMTLREL